MICGGLYKYMNCAFPLKTLIFSEYFSYGRVRQVHQYNREIIVLKVKQSCFNRDYSHVTKSRIFKNLNLEEKSIATFAANC